MKYAIEVAICSQNYPVMTFESDSAALARNKKAKLPQCLHLPSYRITFCELSMHI